MSPQSNTDLQSSIKVLMTLFVMMEQDLQAFVSFDKDLDQEDNPDIEISDNWIVKVTVIDALRFSIITKACSFLEEWDKILGVKNEPSKLNKIRLAKRIAKPARTAISKWKDLKLFRNQVVSHNLRDKENQFTLNRMGEYNCPQTLSDHYSLVALIERMIRSLTSLFPSETINSMTEIQTSPQQRQVGEMDWNKTMQEVDDKMKNLQAHL